MSPCPCTRGPVVGHDGHCCITHVPDDGDHTTPAEVAMPCHPDTLTRMRAEARNRR